MTPRSPAITDSAWAVVSTITIVRSVAAATSSGDPATLAPRSRSGSTLSRATSCTTSENPFLARFNAMGPPMLPSPMNPTAPGIANLLGGGRALALLERGDHVASEELEAAPFQLQRNQSTRVQLGHDAVDSELLAELLQPVDDPGGGPERDLAGQDVLIGESGHAIDLGLPAVGGTGAGASDRRGGEPALTLEEIRQARARLFDGALFGGRDVDRDAEIDARLAGMSGFVPRLPVVGQMFLEIGDL